MCADAPAVQVESLAEAAAGASRALARHAQRTAVRTDCFRSNPFPSRSGPTCVSALPGVVPRNDCQPPTRIPIDAPNPLARLEYISPFMGVTR